MTTLKDTRKGSVHREANCGQCMCSIYFVYKEKWPDVQWFTDSWTVANGLVQMVREVERDDRKICGKDIW